MKIRGFFSKHNNFILLSKPYEWLWQKNNMLKRYIYIVIPIVVLFAFYFLLFFYGAFTNYKFSFSVDYANSLLIPYIFLFGYYCCAWLHNYSNKVINNLVENFQLNTKTKKKYRRAECGYKIAQLIMYFIPFASLFFIGVAEADGNLSWYAALPTWLFIYYKLLIGFSWYLSASIVITAVFSLIRIHFVLRDIDEKNIDVYNADNNCGFFACNKLIIIFLGISLYYLFAGGMMFLADFNAFQYGVEHTFYLYPWTGFIFLIMFFLYLVVVLIPMIECISKVGKKLMKKKKN